MVKPVRNPELIPPCKHCGGSNSTRKGFSNGYQMYFCKDCQRRWTESPYLKGPRPSGLTKAERNAQWKKANRAKCTERDRLRRQQRKLERQQAQEKDEATES